MIPNPISREEKPTLRYEKMSALKILNSGSGGSYSEKLRKKEDYQEKVELIERNEKKLRSTNIELATGRSGVSSIKRNERHSSETNSLPYSKRELSGNREYTYKARIIEPDPP